MTTSRFSRVIMPQTNGLFKKKVKTGFLEEHIICLLEFFQSPRDPTSMINQGNALNAFGYLYHLIVYIWNVWFKIIMIILFG
jgi:hypothetical protein